MSPVTKRPFFTHVKNDFFSCSPADFMPLLKKLTVMALKDGLPYTAKSADWWWNSAKKVPMTGHSNAYWNLSIISQKLSNYFCINLFKSYRRSVIIVKNDFRCVYSLWKRSVQKVPKMILAFECIHKLRWQARGREEVAQMSSILHKFIQ